MWILRAAVRAIAGRRHVQPSRSDSEGGVPDEADNISALHKKGVDK